MVKKKDELFDAGNPTETITTRISRTDFWEAGKDFAIPHIHYSCEEIFAGKVGLLNIDFISGQGQTSSLKTVRSVIASWYKILRLIATVLFFICIDIYRHKNNDKFNSERQGKI